jgi:hypothetical protein
MLVATVASAATAQDVAQTVFNRRPSQPTCCPPVVPGMPGTSGTPGTPSADPNAPAQPPATDAFAQASEAGAMPSASYQPAFFGDLIGVYGTRLVQDPSGGISAVRLPSGAAATVFKTTDSESPRPQDRVYYNYNLFTGAARTENLPTGSGAEFDVHRHVIGLEKTFLSGNASVGLRLPFALVTGFGQTDSRFGDMSIVTKYAFINNRCTGNLLSGGLVVTVPTGGGIPVNQQISGFGLPFGDPRVNFSQQTTTIFEVVLQPYVGGIYNLTSRLYVHGFSSFLFPTNSQDAIIWTGDLGTGFWLYRNFNDRFVQGLIPTVELHTDIPLNHRGPTSMPLSFNDQVNMTYGVYVALPRSVVGFAVGVPFVGPRPYDIEYAANYQLRF